MLRRTLTTLLLLTACNALAAPLPLGWEGNAPRYQVYRGIEMLAETLTTQATVELPADSLSTLVVVAIYPTGERLTSEPFTVQPVTASFSPALQSWQTGAVFFVEVGAKQFFRFSYPLPLPN